MYSIIQTYRVRADLAAPQLLSTDSLGQLYLLAPPPTKVLQGANYISAEEKDWGSGGAGEQCKQEEESFP